MNRPHFLKNILGLGVLSMVGCQLDRNKAKAAAAIAESTSPGEHDSLLLLRQRLIAAWLRSEKMTMMSVEQMPPELFTFKYTKEAMSFAEQWRHCVIFTCGQLAGNVGIQNPYKNVKLPVQMAKDHVIRELQNMYSFVRQSIAELPDEKLVSDCEFAGDTIPIWRLYYALENHIIHHRGQCVVYLRLKGVIPKGYYGW